LLFKNVSPLSDFFRSVKQQAFKTVSVFLKLTEGFIKESASGTAGPTGDKKPLESGANGKAAVNGADGDGGWLSSFTRTVLAKKTKNRR